MPLPTYLQEAVDEGVALKAYYDGLTPGDIQSQQMAQLDEFVNNYITYHLPRSIRAAEATGQTEISFDIPPADTGIHPFIVDPINAIEGISAIVTPGGGADRGDGTNNDLLVITWPGAV